MQLRIGDLRHRLTLEQALRDDDDSGGATETWVALAEVWSAVRAMNGDERTDADQLAARVTHEIWIRRRSGVSADMRFRKGGRVFEIRAVLDDWQRGRLLRCLCEERDL
ncbi:MAG: phage head closure protein [Hyphomicrobiaceae bacterium]